MVGRKDKLLARAPFWEVIPSRLDQVAETYSRADNMVEKRKALLGYIANLRTYLVPNLEENAPFDLRPLHELEEALRQLNNREKPPLFTPPAQRGARMKRGQQFWLARASAVMTLLMQRYEASEEAAAKRVVSELKSRGLPLPGKGRSERADWRLLQDWRDTLTRKGKPNDAPAWYRDALLVGEVLFLSSHFPDGERALIDALLDPTELPTGPRNFTTPVFPSTD